MNTVIPRVLFESVIFQHSELLHHLRTSNAIDINDNIFDVLYQTIIDDNLIIIPDILFTIDVNNIYNIFNVSPDKFKIIYNFLDYILFDYSFNYLLNNPTSEDEYNLFYETFIRYCIDKRYYTRYDNKYNRYILFEGGLMYNDLNGLQYYINYEYDLLIKTCSVTLFNVLVTKYNLITPMALNNQNVLMQYTYDDTNINIILYWIFKYDRIDIYNYILSLYSSDTIRSAFYANLCKFIKLFNNNLTTFIKNTQSYKYEIACLESSLRSNVTFDDLHHHKYICNLLMSNININSTEYSGESALFYAIANNEYTNTKLLLQNGANIYLTTNRGKNIFNFSSNKISKKIYSLFTQYELNIIKHL